MVERSWRHLRTHGPTISSFSLDNRDNWVLLLACDPFLLGKDRLKLELLLNLAWVGFKAALLKVSHAMRNVLLGSDEA